MIDELHHFMRSPSEEEKSHNEHRLLAPGGVA
jgi:hypothetical protein